MRPSRVVIADAAVSGLWSLAARLRADGLEVAEVNTTDAALVALGAGSDVLVVHHATPVDVERVLARARASDPDIYVLTLADAADGGLAQAAGHVVHLPIDLHDIAHRITREVAAARVRRRLHAVLVRGHRRGIEALAGDSPAIARLRTTLRKLSLAPAVTSLVTGERGSGRGLVARILHDTSERREGPFVSIDCTPDGPDRWPGGSFGAREAGWTAVRDADEGTVVFDNVERLVAADQVALLRLLEEGMVRSGDASPGRAADIRVVATTTASLEAEVEAGRFRRDLYYRLNIVTLDIPPLRRRGDDVLMLARLFAARERKQRQLGALEIDADATVLLKTYDWPGNVRELRCVIERAAMLASKPVLSRPDLAAIDRAPRGGGFSLPAAGISLDDLERRLVVEALERTHGNQTQAAQLLGLHRDQVRYRMRKYGLRS